jgi:hypothetical protein
MMHLIGWNRIPVIILIFVLFCVQAASAEVVVQGLRVDPAGTIPPDGQVQVSLDLVVIPSGGGTFQPGHTLVFSTDLRDPHWVIVIILDGVQNDRSEWYNDVVFLNGYLLTYPTTRDVALMVDLTGKAPAGPSNITLAGIVELNNEGRTVPGSEINIPGNVALHETPLPVTANITSPTIPTTPPPVQTTTAPLSDLLPLAGIVAAYLVHRIAG